MATVTFGSPNVASAAMFATPSQSNIAYTNHRIQEFAQTMARYDPAMADRFMHDVNSMRASDEVRDAIALTNHVRSMFSEDAVRYLSTIGDIQNAPSQMRRYIMAHPEVRQLYIDDRIAGYGEDYEDTQPGAIGASHGDYCDAVSGVVQTQEDGTGLATIYHDVWGDVKLSALDKLRISRTWQGIDRYLEDIDDETVDLTDPENSLIG